MGLARLAAAAVIAIVALNSGAKAGGGEAPKEFATEYGQTLPPYGYVQFCRDTPSACLPHRPASKLMMSSGLWSALQQVNSYVNGRIAAASDQDLYGVKERWTLPSNNKGDCEDYVLLKKQSLENLGVAAGNLLITVVLDELLEGHAVLTVATTAGDYVLDNRMDDIRRWNETRYTYLKRQSSANPTDWVALMQQTDLPPQPPSASQ
jgi:predicted transglutaminase-like cysteine proteinase